MRAKRNFLFEKYCNLKSLFTIDLRKDIFKFYIKISELV